MSDPLTDHHRHPPPPVHPGLVEVSGDHGSVARGLRTVVAFVLGATSALVLGAAVVVAVGAVILLSAERPLRPAAVVLVVPDVRAWVADEWADDLEEERAVPLAPADGTALADAIDDVLASPELHRQLRELRVEGGRLDGTELLAVLVRELGAASADAPPDVRRTLEQLAGEVTRELEVEAGSADVHGLEDGMRDLRRFVLGAALVLAVPSLVVGALALAVARRRALTAVLIASGALLLAVVALAPGRFVVERLPGPLSVPGQLLAAVGELTGAGAMWALVLCAAVPPGLWWALRAWHDQRSDAAPTT